MPAKPHAHDSLPSQQHAWSGRASLSVRELHRRREWVFLILAGIFLGTLTMLNILGISRFITLYDTGLTISGTKLIFLVAVGVLPYPITFLCTDFISELYGRKRASQVVWVGFLLNLWVVAILWLGSALPGAPIDPTTGMPAPPVWNDALQSYTDHDGWAFFHIRNLAYGAVAASMIAYLAAQLIDVHVFHFWKKLTKGKHLWLRNNGSTLVSQLVDTAAVITITHFYAHALPVIDANPIWPQLMVFIMGGYVFKAGAAFIDTIPFYIGAHWLAKYLRLPPPTEMQHEV